jgi:tetratricopeptide (TPR) repeat protein
MAGSLHADEVRLLADIGFMALSAGLFREAEEIFQGVKAARPKGEAGAIGLALLRMAENDHDQAVAILKSQRRSLASRAFLSLALAKQGDRQRARKIAQSVLEGPPNAFAALAEDVLGLLDAS